MYTNANNALLFLVDTVFALYIIVVLLRILLQLTHADFRNPVSQFVWRATAPPVGFLAMGIPRWRNVDVPAAVFVIILCFINIELDLLLSTLDLGPQPVLALWWAILKALVLLCNLYFFTILIQVLMSWLSPGQYSPATAILWTINEPLLRPVRNRLPLIAGLDLSPLVVIILIQVVSRLLPLPVLFR